MNEIPLTQGYVMRFSDEDSALATGHKFYAVRNRRGSVYAFRAGKVGHKKMPVAFHREVLNAAPGEEIDHIKGVNPAGLKVVDNRRDNLRRGTHHQNTCGFQRPRKNKSSGYRGVARHRTANKWEAYIMSHYKKIHLGLFEVEEDAARAYDAAARLHFGEFAHLNFPV